MESKHKQSLRPARTSAEIKAEIEDRFGFFPPFFEPALETPEVLENLWQQTLSAYVNNPLPALFKEKLFAYLSRYCAVPYCIVFHSCTLRPLGMTAREVLDLIEQPPLISEKDLEAQLSVLTGEVGPMTAWPKPDSALEKSLLNCSIFTFLKPASTEGYQTELRRLLGEVNFAHLSAFLSYVKSCHLWVETHPEISYEADKRAQDNLAPLLKEDPVLGDFFKNYDLKVMREEERREEQLRAERKQAEEVLKVSEKKYRDVVENATDLIFMNNIYGNFTFVNTVAEKMTEYSKDELIGMNYAEITHPDDIEKTRRLYEEQFKTRSKEIKFENRFVTKSGRIRCLWVHSILNMDGDYVVGWQNIGRDITTRKLAEEASRKAEEALRESEEQFRTLTQTATDAIIGIDEKGRITIWNRAASKMFGCNKKEAIGSSMHTLLVPKQYQAKAKKGLIQFFKSGKGPVVGKTVELTALRKDGAEFPIELSLSSVKRHGAWHATGVIRNITERKRAEEKLKEKIEQLDRANRLMVGRELKMVELKREINTLLEKAGQPKKYTAPDEVK